MKGLKINRTLVGLALVLTTLAGGITLAAEAPPRPGLFFDEPWVMATPGEHLLGQDDVTNPFLELKIYGLQGEEGLMINGVQGSEANPPHTWSGVCGYGCTFAFRHRDSYADLSGTARIMIQSKTSGFHKIRPFIKLADGATYVGDLEIVNLSDFLYTEFRVSDVKWMVFNTETGITRGVLLDDVDLSRVDEIGFADLQPGAGHGNGGWSDVGAIQVYANAVAR